MPLRAALLSALHTQPAAPAPAAAARPRRRSSTAASPIDGRRSRIDTPRRRLPAAAAAGGTGGGTGAVLLLPGFLYGSRQYEGLAADLRTKGFHAGGLRARPLLPLAYSAERVRPQGAPRRRSPLHPPPLAEIVPASLSDWLPIITGGSFDWYLERLDAALCDMHARWGARLTCIPCGRGKPPA